MPNDNWRLAWWCVLVSVIVALCVWVLIGSPEVHQSGLPLAPGQLGTSARR